MAKLKGLHRNFPNNGYRLLMRNTAQFKSHNDSQNLCLDLAIQTIKRQAIFRKTTKKQ